MHLIFQKFSTPHPPFFHYILLRPARSTHTDQFLGAPLSTVNIKTILAHMHFCIQRVLNLFVFIIEKSSKIKKKSIRSTRWKTSNIRRIQILYFRTYILVVSCSLKIIIKRKQAKGTFREDITEYR